MIRRKSRKKSKIERKKRERGALSRETIRRRRIPLRIFQRDGFKCRICGREKTTFNAHHLIPFSHCPSLRGDLLNFITVCEDCHKKICHNGDFRSINLNISVQYILENLKYKRVVPNRRHFLDYLKRYERKYPEVIKTLESKRVRPRRKKVV